MKKIFPWQNAVWQSLMARIHDARMPHALLLSGQKGLGKNQLAELFAKALLCYEPQPDHTACGKCSACLLYQAGTHPDFSYVTPLEDSKNIAVDQVREICRYFTLKSQYGGYKIVIISPADQMNNAAANSLLKTLEEPAGQTLLILVTDKPHALLPTIRSRCQHIKFNVPSRDQALPWLTAQLNGKHEPEHVLSLAQGSPLLALTFAEQDLIESRQDLLSDLRSLAQGKLDPVSIADKWTKYGIKPVILWLTSWVSDMVRLKFISHPSLLANKDITQYLHRFAEHLEVKALFAFFDQLVQALKLADGQANAQMLMEDILIDWSRLFERAAN